MVHPEEITKHLCALSFQCRWIPPIHPPKKLCLAFTHTLPKYNANHRSMALSLKSTYQNTPKKWGREDTASIHTDYTLKTALQVGMKPTLHYPDLVSVGIWRWQKLAPTRSRERCIAALCLNIKTPFSTQKSHVNGRGKVIVRATHHLCFEMEQSKTGVSLKDGRDLGLLTGWF